MVYSFLLYIDLQLARLHVSHLIAPNRSQFSRLWTLIKFASGLSTSSDGPPALVAHSPVGGLLSRFRPGETQSRRGTHSSDSVHSANPEECGAGVTHPDTAHEMRIPLRPLRMSKSYRRLRKRSLRAESAKALLEMSVPTVSPSSET